MTSRLLQASLGSPDYDGIRDALRRDTSTEVLAVRGLAVRAAVLPLFKRDAAGDLAQAVRITVTGDGAAGLDLALRDGDGEPVASGTVPAGPDAAAGAGRTVTLLVPEVDGPRRFTLEVRDGDGLVGAAPLEVTPQRKWSVFVVHHSHLDIGYTDTQGTVLRHHLDYLDAALRLARETDGRPDDARFRWSVESSMPALQWLATRPRELVGEFAERARAGDIEVTAFPMQLHTEACSTEELYRQLRFVDDLRRRHGIEVRSAMHTDIPGAVVGVVDALNAAGVRYLAAAHNWAGRSVPYITGGDKLGRPFRWRSPGGGELIVWFTDTPHGMAYMEGNTVGLVDGYDLAEDLLPRYLGSLADRPYPYGPGTFGWYAAPGQVGAAKDPDVLDAVHLRVQGAHADNAGPSIVPADIALRWNRTWAYPRLRTATNAEFFEHVEEHHADRLQTHEGDWTDWWADGLGSGARPLGHVRRAQNILRSAETLHALADGRGGEGGGAEAALDAAYDRAALFDEHTWGAANPWEDAEEGGDSGGLQWTRKSQVGYQAHDDALDLLQSGAQRLGATFEPCSDPDALASFVVVNPGTAARTDVVRAFLPRDVVASDVPIQLIDARTGDPVPHREEEVDPDVWPTRPIGRHLDAVLPALAGHGYTRLDVLPADEDTPAPAPTDLGSDGTIENEFYRVVFDLKEGHLASVFDKTAGRELVNGDAVAGFGQYVYDRYATAPHHNHLSGHMLVHDTTLLGDRAIGTHATVARCERTPAGERLVVELRGKGVDWLRVTLDLYAGVPRLDLRYQLGKQPTAGKEAVFFAFPFAVDGPPAAWELTGGVGGTGVPSVPGSAEHMRPIRHWVAFEDPELTVAWATLEAPLVQFGSIHMPYAPFPPTLENEDGTVYSWALNNIWDTNFPSQQQGETTFRYAIASGPGGRPGHRLGAATAAGLTDPFVATLATGGAAGDGAAGSGGAGGGVRTAEPLAPGEPVEMAGRFLTVDDPDVLITSVGRPRHGKDGLVVRLQSLAAGPVETGLRVPGAVTATVTAGLERDARDLPVRDGTITVRLPARGIAAVTIQR
ncbi:glycoside hydrolase family 38 C-terminal domain-containing protein [Spirillospora sp. NBC_01491]|uniref:glycoside hydrolase family 38 N-terminal domain-containing protein n=1 Tax=Spirillospora sp. NBC_01491 TaxID=2976007 RepID=UPI002E3523BF|nr:glycoside hydrolase family 38 C-terminal domain-containing protein [Spirillospora sp. NBC_01491]